MISRIRTPRQVDNYFSHAVSSVLSHIFCLLSFPLLLLKLLAFIFKGRPDDESCSSTFESSSQCKHVHSKTFASISGRTREYTLLPFGLQHGKATGNLPIHNSQTHLHGRKGQLHHLYPDRSLSPNPTNSFLHRKTLRHSTNELESYTRTAYACRSGLGFRSLLKSVQLINWNVDRFRTCSQSHPTKQSATP
ncbi:hypothetical protein T440DRAFT_468320 [Plenodomus tracheiphilus IPT5]|uniref:Uncharacterized protein n=1 Tax=Plenodomus tracheiphilus IPT5 TaxID=1408161 RepID=A0A6A7B8M9_9PLEO|nr:hypothetical protein T440DRAFT_468320 [Plenodomus tracheiphilus IPT5]